MWVICDDAFCHLFSTDANGHVYRFPDGCERFPPQDEQAGHRHGGLPDSRNLSTGTSVYQVEGSSTYLMLVGAVSSTGQGITAPGPQTDIAGPWTPLAAKETTPFAGAADVTAKGTTGAKNIGQGEILRSGEDQRLTISPCRLRYLYQGDSGNLGLLTQTNSSCS